MERWASRMGKNGGWGDGNGNRFRVLLMLKM
jgi:hypothetical protein